MFESGFKVVDDLPDENVGIGKVIRVFGAFVSEPEDVEASRVAADEFPVI
jgi:hypothetical protein